MDELVKMVSEKTGLSEEMSKVAVDTVIDYLKDKLPAPIDSQIDTVLEGGDASSMLGSLGGMFGS